MHGTSVRYSHFTRSLIPIVPLIKNSSSFIIFRELNVRPSSHSFPLHSIEQIRRQLLLDVWITPDMVDVCKCCNWRHTHPDDRHFDLPACRQTGYCCQGNDWLYERLTLNQPKAAEPPVQSNANAWQSTEPQCSWNNLKWKSAWQWNEEKKRFH